MLHFGLPYITNEDGYAILNNAAYIDDKKYIIWFKVEDKFGKYLCTERGDAYLIASLHYAMANHHDIKLDVPVSEVLLFNLKTYLIPALIENNPELYSPNISCEVIAESLPNAGAVGTGISCGVDSLHVLANHTLSTFKSMNVTHLTFNNVGSHGEGERAKKLFRDRIERPRSFANEYGFEFVMSDSNLMDVIEQNHFKTHTYSSMFPIFCLQKLYSTYFYASAGYKFNEFSLNEHSAQRCCGSYELLSLPLFTNGTLRVYSEGMGKGRLEKLQTVVHYKPSFKYLNVCLAEGENCSKCEKCVRTLLGLEVLNVLEDYQAVFDISYYKQNRKWYLQQLVYKVAERKHDYLAMYPHFKKDITLCMRLKGIMHRIPIFVKEKLRHTPTFYNFAKKMYRL